MAKTITVCTLILKAFQRLQDKLHISETLQVLSSETWPISPLADLTCITRVGSRILPPLFRQQNKHFQPLFPLFQMAASSPFVKVWIHSWQYRKNQTMGCKVFSVDDQLPSKVHVSLNKCFPLDQFKIYLRCWLWPQIYKGDPRTCTILSPHGAQIGSIWVFPVIKITIVCQVHMSPTSTAVWVWRQTCIKCRTARKYRGCTYALCFCMFGQQELEDPQFETRGWRRHFTGLCMRSGISLVYLWLCLMHSFYCYM